MKEKALKPHVKGKERYALKAFLWGAAIAAVFIIPCMIIDKGMYLYYGDYNVQVIPFYQTMVRAIHSGEWGWNWNTDLGSSFVGSYTFYNLGSPFFWILLLFPAKAVPYVMGPLTIAKFGISSLTAYIYLKRYTKSRSNAVIGAVLYAFSGAAIYNMVFHFIDAMAIFPLLLVALDKYIYESKRGVFAAAVALCAITNYYLFAGEAVFCLIYWLVRMITKSYKIDARRVLYLIIEAIVGTGIAAFILLPSVYHIVGNNRASADVLNGDSFWAYNTGLVYLNTFVSFFMPPELPQDNVYVANYAHQWSSVTGYLPLFGMAGVFAVIFNKHRNKWIRTFYGVCAVFMFVPVLNSSFQFFTDVKYTRWFFMLLLIMSLGSVMALEDPATKWKKAITTNLCVTTAIILIIGFTPEKITTKIGFTYTQYGIQGNAPMFWLYSALALINIGLCALFVKEYNTNRESFKRIGSIILAATMVLDVGTTFVLQKITDKKTLDPVALDMVNCGDDIGIDDIDLWRSDVLSTATYTTKPFDGDTVDTRDYPELENETTEYIELQKKQNEDWLAAESDNATVFWGIPSFGSFHSLISSSITDFYTGNDFERATLSNFSLGLYGYRALLSNKYLFDYKDSLSVADENGESIVPGWKYLKTWKSYDIYENEYAIPIATTYDKFILNTEFEEIPTQYKHLVLLDTLVVDSIDQMFMMASVNMEQAFSEDYTPEVLSRENYIKNCEERIASGCTDFTRDKKGFSFNIKADENDEYVFVGVPFDNGWSATVNGEKAEIVKMDYGFMSVRIPAGQESAVRFDFHTQGTLYGGFFTGVCLFILLIYLAVFKIRDKQEAEAEENKGKKDGESGDKKIQPPKDDSPQEPKADEKAEDKTDEDNSAEEKSEGAAEEEDLDDMTIFDIVKQTEEQTMMHVYKRVPVVLERGVGSVGYDINGKKFIDFTSGIGVNALGYADGRWGEAVEKQMYDLQHMSNLYYNTTQISLAEMLCMKTGFSKVFFANSGAEANECAIKIARKYGSDKFGEKHTHIITLENSFHGRTITTLSATGQDVFHKHFTPFTEGFSFAKANDMDSIRSCTTEDTCAVMIELIQGEGGVNPLDKKFVTDLAQYCKEKDLLLIVDEIQTGVGRTGKLYCYENFGIQPDVITSAKALGGGLPLSACMCTERLKDVLTPGTNGTTFGGNPIACAGALKILDIVAEDEFLAEVRAKGEYMRKRIKAMKGVKEVRGMGLMIGIVLEKDNAGEVLGKCAETGLLVLTAKSLVRLLPPLNIEYEDIDEGLDILEKAINS